MADNIDVILDCPACGKPMKKVYMSEQNVYLDVCSDGCGGIYFDNREFNKFDEAHESIDALLKIFEKEKKYDKVDESEERICPACDMKMVKNYSSAKHSITIDECYQCGGKFLDYDELEKIRAEYPNEEARVEDVLKELYSAVGVEIKKQEDAHKSLETKSSLLSKVIRFKYGK